MNNQENLARTRAILNTLNAEVFRLARRDRRNGAAPSDELKAATNAAKKAWREWCNALDIAEGHAPTFPACH